jgi:hypothetical protein
MNLFAFAAAPLTTRRGGSGWRSGKLTEFRRALPSIQCACHFLTTFSPAAHFFSAFLG